MSRWNEREIARKLAERDELEPPAGLLEKIKGEIPPTIPVGVPRLETRRPVAPPQRWLIAASLVAMVGAGLFALRVQKEAPPAGLASPPARESAKDARAAAPPTLQSRLQERRLAKPPLEVPPPPPPQAKPVPKETERSLQALGYVSQAGRARQSEGATGGVVGGTAAAPPPAAPAPAPPAVQQPEPQEAITATAESPLADERKTDSARQEKEKTPTARDPWATLQMNPGTVADRINVGGNESGQQSGYVGPGNPFEDVAGHPVSTFRLDVGRSAESTTRRDLAAAKPADPRSLRIEGLLSALDAAPRARGAQAITAEGAPTPFVPGPLFRLLRFHLGGVPGGTPVEVRFDPAVVVRYRRIEGVSAALYEIELRPGAPRDGRVAALRLIDRSGTRRDLTLSALAPSWEKASSDFRLTALTMRFLEILGNRPDAKEELAGIVRQVREVGKEPSAAELADLMEQAAGLRP